MKTKVDKAFFNVLNGLVGKGQKRGKTILQMSIEAGISYVTFYKYVTGKMTPGVENLVKIADYFGVSTDYLLGRAKK
jgi:transcriptional regulator with XRE-family HTH domain